MGWIAALIIGRTVVWLASIVMKTNARMGCIANVVVGVVGALPGESRRAGVR
jgi:uncharacterized membrane protein YeaQ/YmgE (transglycosylase-associated protein family)